MKRRLGVPAVLLLAATAVAGVVVTAPVADAVATASRYVATDPVRLVDTREGGAPLGPGGTLPLDLSDRVPADATAVVVNLTADAPSAAGFLTIYPADTGRPDTSSLNKRAGETRSNSVTVALPPSGSRLVSVYNQTGTTQVVVDLFGYYVPRRAATGDAPAASYYPYSAPFRALDSRSGSRFGPNSGAVIVLPAPAGATDVSAVAVNLTAVDPTGPGYLTAWTGLGDRPTVSTVNYGYDAATPNFAVVPAYQDAAGVHFTVANAVAVTDVLVDVFGYYAPTGGSAATAYVPVAPTRLGDTRTSSPVGAGGSVDTAVPVGVGDTAVAANVNVTAVGATAPTYLSVYATGTDRPTVSTLNPAPNQAVPNAAQTPVGADGRFRVFNFAGSVDVVSDLQGYFVADTSPNDGDGTWAPVPPPPTP